MAGVSILSYLHYLHDVNRKLLQRGGLENVLYRKPVSQHPYYHQLDQPDPALVGIAAAYSKRGGARRCAPSSGWSWIGGWTNRNRKRCQTAHRTVGFLQRPTC
jgi:hypothetical protein